MGLQKPSQDVIMLSPQCRLDAKRRINTGWERMRVTKNRQMKRVEKSSLRDIFPVSAPLFYLLSLLTFFYPGELDDRLFDQ